MEMRRFLSKCAFFLTILRIIPFNFVATFTISNINSPSNPIPNPKSSSRRPNIVDNDMEMHLHPAALPRPSNVENRRTASNHLAHSLPISSSRRPPPQTMSHFKEINSNFSSYCRLPPDFWCDDPNVAIECTGTLEYCEKYKRHRRLHKFNIKLAFETGCSDSQKLIVHRLYPRVLSNPEMADAIDFKAHPWGLARRHSDQNIRCHHGSRECSGNRLLSCALNFYKWNSQMKNRILFCFMSHMMAHGEPESGIVECLSKFWADQAAIGEIMECAQSVRANQFQTEDEEITGQILLNRPRFVPFLSLNRKSNIHMQTPLQLLLPEKIRHWNKTVAKNLMRGNEEKQKQKYSRNNSSYENCEFPPEFWCADSSITQNCFNAQLCTRFGNANFDRPIHLRIIYNSQFEPSREYLLQYLSGQLMNPNSPKFVENSKKMRVELEPAHFTKRALGECGVGADGFIMGIGRGCTRRILEICIGPNVEYVEERNRLLICLNSIPTEMNAEEVLNNWVENCSPALVNRDRIIQCARNERIWTAHNAELVLQQNQRALSPEPRRTDPWILVNGYSLSTVQNYANVLEHMICLWYSGKGHDREKCGRCDYEPSHC